MISEIQLKEVTVFQNSASFKMVGQYHCSNGVNEVLMDHLTNKLDKDSIRVRGIGPGKIVNIIIEKIYSDELIKEKIKEFTKKRNELQKKRKEIEENLIDTHEMKNKAKLAQERFSQEFPKWFSYGKIDIESVKSMTKLFQEQIKEISNDIRKMEQESEDFQEKIYKINQQINELGYDNQSESESYYKVIAIIEADEEADFEIELSFMLYQAHWTPLYDIILDKSDVEIELMANVYNNTGIDWNDIMLNISTANTEPVILEKPQPFNINHISPIITVNGKSIRGSNFNKDVNGRFDTIAQCNAVYEVPADGQEIGGIAGEFTELGCVDSSMSSSFGVQVYNLKSKFTIVSDKNPKPVHLFKEKLPSIIQYFWTTTSPNRVLCNNKIKNKNNLILPGPAKIYMDDEFIGETQLGLIAPHQEFKLGERISYDIKIKKIMKKKSKQKEGMLKGKNGVSYEYNIEIENLNGAKEQLILYERLPHSISEKIKVKLGDFSEKYVRNVMNVFKFVIDLDKVNGKKKVITYDYDVVYDKDVNVFPLLP